ncbi:G5 domain-containing protein [Streptococcus sp. 20-1249]|uniref:G5 domain-containing protein n=1 Tax=Streptococcus hepaticus TaxID=3349163 RepID=UPI00374A87B4
MNKKMKKFAIASVVTLFSTNILSAATFQNLHLGNHAGVVRAEEPPVDEEIPSLAELKKINDSKLQLQEAREYWAEDQGDETKEAIQEILDAIDIAGLKAINKQRSNELLAEIEAFRAEVFGTTPTPTPPTPVVETKTEVIPVTTRYEADPNLDYGQKNTIPGTAGSQTYTTTDGVRNPGSEKVTQAMVPTVVKVGTKAKVEIVKTPAPTGEVLEENSNLAKGVRELKTPAKEGSKTVTTTYTLVDATSDKVHESTSESNVIPGTQAVYYIGTKEVPVTPITPAETTENIVERVTVKPTEKRVANPDMYEGETTRTPGVEGTDLVTYKVYKLNGVETKREEVNRVHEKPVVDEVVQYGTKKKPVTAISEIKVDEPIKFTSRTEENPNLPEGTRNVKVTGVDGVKTVTYAVTTVDGVETDRVKTGETEKVAPVQEVIEIGTKKVVEQPWTPIVTPEVKSETKTEVIKFTSRTEENPNLEKGVKNVKVQGVDGLRTIVYSVTTVNGIETKRVVTSDTKKDAVEEVIEVGTKEVKEQPWTPISIPTVSEEVKTEVIKHTSRTVENDKLAKGETRLLQAGQDGLHTVVYAVTTVDGKEVKRDVTSETTVPAIEEVIEVGTLVTEVPIVAPEEEEKPEAKITEETVTEEIAFETEMVENDQLVKGQTRVVRQGRKGLHTQVYKVITIEGEEPVRILTSETTTPAINEIVEVGMKEVTPTPKPDKKQDEPKEQVTPQAKEEKVLPKTGEQTSFLAAVGSVLLTGLLALVTFKRKKE